MKKTELKKLEELNKVKKLPKSERMNIQIKTLDNALIAINMILLLLILVFIPDNIDRERIQLIYKIASLVILSFAIFTFELSYRKENGILAISGIEILILSIIVLFTTHPAFNNNTIKILCISIFAYYLLKTYILYRQRKKEHLKNTSDIPEIVKKESKDPLFEEEQKRIMAQKGIKKRKTTQKKTTEKKEKKKKSN